MPVAQVQFSYLAINPMGQHPLEHATVIQSCEAL
jgi:hypothetical protein